MQNNSSGKFLHFCKSDEELRDLGINDKGYNTKHFRKTLELVELLLNMLKFEVEL